MCNRAAPDASRRCSVHTGCLNAAVSIGNFRKRPGCRTDRIGNCGDDRRSPGLALRGELLILFLLYAPQHVTASAGVQSAAQLPSRRISSPGCGVNSTITVRRGTPSSSTQTSTMLYLKLAAFPAGGHDETRP